VAQDIGVLGFVGKRYLIHPYKTKDLLCGLRVKMCVWLGVSRGLDLAFLNAD